MPHADSPQDTPTRIVEPERLRALSHPLRLELLEFLNDFGPATATQCAHHTGESVPSCSFHLRQLEKYGFVERAERRGREKPWQAILGSYSAQPDPQIPGSALATGPLAALQVQRASEAALTSLNHMLRKQPIAGIAAADLDQWIAASTITRRAAWLTLEELAAVSAAFQEIFAPYSDRSNPADRPEGAVRVRTLAIALPDAASPQPSHTAKQQVPDTHE